MAPLLTILATRWRHLAVDPILLYSRYIKANWRTTLSDRSSASSSQKPLVYGLGTAISSILASLVCLAGLLSMLLLGDGQCPAVFLQLASLTLVIIY